MYSSVVLGVEHHHFEKSSTTTRTARATTSTRPHGDDWKALVGRYKGIVEKQLGKALPAGSARAALGRVGAVFGSWMNNRAIKYRELHAIPGELGHRP
jgi:pyruvate,orthophosphate dikinase